MDCDTSFAPRAAKRIGGRETLKRRRGGVAAIGFLAGLLLAGAPALRAQAAWQDADIGTVAAAGSSSASGAGFVVTGSGADIWGAADAFYYRFQSWTGDGDVIARVTSIDDTDSWAKAGIMFRDGNSPGGAAVLVAVTPQGVTAMQHRAAAGGDTTLDTTVWQSTQWLKLSRRGNVFTGYWSGDGSNWNQLTAVTIAMAATVNVGLAVTSHHDGVVCSATFNPAVTPNTPSPTTPPPPTGLYTQVSANGMVHLVWANNATNATSIQIERTATSGTIPPPDASASFQLVTTVGPTATTYDDTVSAGFNQAFYYRVRAVTQSAVPSDPPLYSAYSNIAAAIVPGGWSNQDIGNVGAAGSGTDDFYTYQVAGSGDDIGGTADALHYYWQMGFSDVIVRLSSMTNPDPGAKAGLMARSDDSAGAPNVFVYATPAGTIGFQYRAAFGATTVSGSSATAAVPVWLRLTRNNNTYTGAYSADGSNWNALGTVTFPIAGPSIGFAVTSHHAGALCQAVFDHLVLTGFSSYLAPVWSTAPMATNVVATPVSTSEIDVTWTSSWSNLTGYWLEASTDGVNYTQSRWIQNYTKPYAAFTGLDASTRYYFRVRCYNPAGYSSYTDPVSAVPSSAVNSPAAPSGLTAQRISGNQIALHWTDNSGNETGFQVERALVDTPFTTIASLGANTTSYTDTGGDYSSTYYYRVRAVNGAAVSPYSSEEWAVTDAAPAGTTNPPPAAPTGLTATAISSSQIRLNWTDNATNETSYEVQQSSDGVTFGTTYAGFAANTTSMTDPALNASSTYYYRVRAVNAAGGSAYSNIASATTQAAPTSTPSGTWSSNDVGAVTLIGGDSSSGGGISVTASGADIWGNADAFRFVYQALNGDGSITARITGMTNTDGWAKAGLMIRETLDANARNAFIAATPTWHGIVAQSRANTGDVTGQFAGPAVNAPYWLRLVRAGNTVTAAASADGANWSTVATLNVTMSSAAYVGFAVTSHNPNQLCTATFDNVTLTTAATQTSGSGVVTITGISPGTAVSGGATTTTSTFTMTGTASPGSQLTIWLDDSDTSELPGTCGSTTVDAGGAWSLRVGVISAGWFRFHAAVGAAASATFTVTVQAGDAAAPVVTNSTVTGQVGTAISPVTVSSTNGPNYFSAPGLQNYGLMIDPGTGVISGTPSAAASGTAVTVTASNGWGSGTATVTLNLTNATANTSGTWHAQDVGAVAAAGHTSTTGGTVTVAGSGADIWGTADAFQFDSQSVSGDFMFTARVASLTDPNAWAKAGLMIRDSLDANARNVFVALTPEQHGVVAQYRANTGDTTGQIAGPFTYAPYWLRLSRSGNTFNAFASPDGVTWTSCATINWMSLAPTAYVGLAVTSHADGTLCTATFDNVSLALNASSSTGTGTSGWSFADIGAVGLAGSNSASGNTITVNGAGADFWGTADAGYFVWKTWTGDGVVEAQVGSMGNTNGWAKAGVMIRESSDPGARNVFVALTPSWHGIVAQARGDPGAVTTQAAGPPANAPYWVRLARTGGTFTASTSSDGVSWTVFATFNVTMNSTADFGFAVTSHDTTQLNQTIFQDPFVGTP